MKIINEFTGKFDSTAYKIVQFLRQNRMSGVEDRRCSIGIHEMEIGQTAHIFDGRMFRLDSFFCSDLRCFLGHIGPEAVKRFTEFAKMQRLAQKHNTNYV